MNLWPILIVTYAFRPRYNSRQRRNWDPFSIFESVRQATLWCNLWVMNVRWGKVKGKPGAGISLIFSKSTKETARLNVSHPTDELLSTELMFSHVLLKNLGFNPRIIGTETSDWSSAPPPSIPKEKYFKIIIKNFYPARDRIRNRSVQNSDSATEPQQLYS